MTLEMLLAMRIMLALSPIAFRSSPAVCCQINCKDNSKGLPIPNIGMNQSAFVLWALGNQTYTDTMVNLGLKYGLCPLVSFGYMGCAAIALVDHTEKSYRLGV